MDRPRPQRRRTAAVLALCWLLGLLLPPLAHAWGSAAGPGGADVCSAAGGVPAAPDDGAQARTHHPCCPLQAPHAAPPPREATTVPPAPPAPLPVAFAARPAPQAEPWSRAQPRAPPRRA